MVMAADHPQVTVLMPVYNGAPYLREAIESILQQSFIDFEFLIIDDGSTDSSVSIVSSYPDPRIRLFENGRNLGLVHTLNRGIDLARGKFIARMDCDDISLPDRFAKQMRFMAAHPEVGVCGGWVEYFMGRELVLQLPVTDVTIKQALPWYNPLAHPTLMIRAAVLKTKPIYYDPEYLHVEDYELWVRLAAVTCFANLPEVLLKYRIHPKQIGRQYSEEQVRILQKIRAKLASDFGEKALKGASLSG
jgi:glycosyltransferase involved in cell wall biosynthesis